MGHMKEMSSVLRNFESSVLPNLSSMESAKSEICTYLNDSKSAFDSVYNGMSQGWKDSNGQSVSASVSLVMNASERLSSSMASDLGNILSRCSEVGDVVSQINDKISEGSSLTPGHFVTKLWSSEYCANDQERIDQLNDEIEQLNNQGEAMLNAISLAAGGISLGISGNMTNGGSLGNYIDFASNYKFSTQEWLAANPIRHPYPYLASSVGCFVAGFVGSVAKLAEGIVDAGATIVADVVSLFGADSSGIVEFVKKDHVGDFIEGTIGNWEGYNPGAVSWGKTFGNIALTTAATLSLNPVALGAVATGHGGETSETVLEATDNLLLATGAGVAVGVAEYWGGKQYQSKKLKKLSSKAVTATSSPKVGPNLALPSGPTVSMPASGRTVIAVKDGYTLYSNGDVADPASNILGKLDIKDFAKWINTNSI